MKHVVIVVWWKRNQLAFNKNCYADLLGEFNISRLWLFWFFSFLENLVNKNGFLWNVIFLTSLRKQFMRFWETNISWFFSHFEEQCNSFPCSCWKGHGLTPLAGNSDLGMHGPWGQANHAKCARPDCSYERWRQSPHSLLYHSCMLVWGFKIV